MVLAKTLVSIGTFVQLLCEDPRLAGEAAVETSQNLSEPRMVGSWGHQIFRAFTKGAISSVGGATVSERTL